MARDSDAYFQALHRALPVSIVQIDRAHRIVWSNQPEASAKLRVDELPDTAVAAIEHTFETGEPSTYEARASNDPARRYTVHVAPLEGDEPSAVLVFSDTTDLRDSEERYRTLATHVPDLISTVSRDLRILTVNRLDYGLLEEEVHNAHLSAFLPAGELEVVAGAIERAFTEGTLQEYDASALIRGELRHYHGRVVALAPDADGTERALVILNDVTERERVTRQLRLSEERLARTLEAADLTLWEWDGRGELPWLSDVHPDDRERVRMAFADHLRGASDRLAIEYRTRTAGGWRWVDTRGRIVEEGRLLGTHLDVTARRHADEERDALRDQLLEAQKMEIVGQLAGGIAHDFNNLLLVIQSHATFAVEGLGDDSPASKDLDAVIAATDRAAELTQQLLAVARRQPVEARPVRVDELVGDVVRLLQRVLPSTIRIEQHCPDPAPLVAGDAGQLQQVLMNLALNARDAMPDGGTLAFETDPNTTDGLVRLCVRDDGIGMAEEVSSRIFEPFFSTKQGKGSGLGLAMAQGIVRRHGGTIDVISAPGRGTAFHILLPAVEGPSPRKGLRVRDRSAVVLVAEDQAMVRAAVRRVLEGAGHEVLEAADGLEAVRLFEANAARVDLALLDVVMPGLTGREVYDRIQDARPGTPVLFTSGYSAEVLEESFLRSTGTRVLPKPYRFPALLRHIQRELSRRSG